MYIFVVGLHYIKISPKFKRILPERSPFYQCLTCGSHTLYLILKETIPPSYWHHKGEQVWLYSSKVYSISFLLKGLELKYCRLECGVTKLFASVSTACYRPGDRFFPHKHPVTIPFCVLVSLKRRVRAAHGREAPHT